MTPLRLLNLLQILYWFRTLLHVRVCCFDQGRASFLLHSKTILNSSCWIQSRTKFSPWQWSKYLWNCFNNSAYLKVTRFICMKTVVYTRKSMIFGIYFNLYLFQQSFILCGECNALLLRYVNDVTELRIIYLYYLTNG